MAFFLGGVGITSALATIRRCVLQRRQVASGARSACLAPSFALLLQCTDLSRCAGDKVVLPPLDVIVSVRHTGELHLLTDLLAVHGDINLSVHCTSASGLQAGPVSRSVAPDLEGGDMGESVQAPLAAPDGGPWQLMTVWLLTSTAVIFALVRVLRTRMHANPAAPLTPLTSARSFAVPDPTARELLQ